jgi:hypothetical protein
MENKMNPRLLYIVTLFLTPSIAPHVIVNAAEIENVIFSDRYRTEAIDLKLRGCGVLRYMIFVKAYAGGLYLPRGIPADQALSGVPKRLEVEYFHPIKRKQFGPATNKIIAKNVDPETLERLRPKIDYHNSLYEDVKPGDRYSLTYIPGKGTELALNGVPKGIVKGSEFADALFSVWLGPNPIDESFKKQLLGM